VFGWEYTLQRRLLWAVSVDRFARLRARKNYSCWNQNKSHHFVAINNLRLRSLLFVSNVLASKETHSIQFKSSDPRKCLSYHLLFDAKFDEALEVAIALTRRTHHSPVAATLATSVHANVMHAQQCYCVEFSQRSLHSTLCLPHEWRKFRFRLLGRR